MIGALSRAVMALAVACLGDARREWALAMEVEFEAASEGGRPLSFAWGCLIAAWRELPRHAEGRLAIASHVLAFALIIPTAALLVASILGDFPTSYLGQLDAQGLTALTGGPEPLLNDANLSAVPPLAALVLLLAAGHLRIAWLVLERDWSRVAETAALIAAATVTLTIFSFVVFVYSAPALTQAVALAIELTAIWALTRWHARAFAASPEPA